MLQPTDKKLVYSIITFLQSETRSTNLSADSKESLEVAIQCLESAYAINETSKKDLEVPTSLMEIFSAAVGKLQLTEEMRKEAEELKMKGNNSMKTENFDEAISHYNQAIKIDPYNAVYYSNRAAAHSKMDKHDAAISDCMKAIKIDPKYSKAYGRMGLAYASLNNHVEARNCYQKAVDIDPQNASYENNLKIAEEKVKEASSNNSNNPNPGMGNLAGIFNNSTFMNMAENLMADPRMQNIISSVMSNDSLSGVSGVEGLMQVGQQLASEINTTNPDLMEQLRQQMQNPDSQQPPPQPKPDDENKET